MGTLLAYSISSGTLLLSMYLIYRLVLASENQSVYNRAVLLAIYFVAFAGVPVWSVAVSMLSSNSHAAMVVDSDYLMDTIVYSVVSDYSADDDLTSAWLRVALWIYVAGMAAVVLHTLIVWGRIVMIVRHGEKQSCGRYTLVLTDCATTAPFSWLRYIVMNRSDYEAAGAMIIAHEMRHLQGCHYADLLLAQIVTVVNWFNPAAWLMREELKTVHEYQADMAVIDSGADVRAYQMLLIKKAVGARFPSLANSLNHSKLKKRITMMLSSESSKCRRWRAIALVPAFGAALYVVNLPAVASTMSTVGDVQLIDRLVDAPKVSENSQDLQPLDAALPVSEADLSAVSGDEAEAVVNVQRQADALSVKPEQDMLRFTGTIVDDSGTPIPGVIVQPDGSNIGTVTDVDGNFILKMPNDGKQITLMFKYPGYANFRISWRGGGTSLGVLALSQSNAREELPNNQDVDNGDDKDKSFKFYTSYGRMEYGHMQRRADSLRRQAEILELQAESIKRRKEALEDQLEELERNSGYSDSIVGDVVKVRRKEYAQRRDEFKRRRGEFKQRQAEFKQRQTDFEQRQAEFEQRQAAFEQRQVEFDQRMAEVKAVRNYSDEELNSMIASGKVTIMHNGREITGTEYKALPPEETIYKMIVQKQDQIKMYVGRKLDDEVMHNVDSSIIEISKNAGRRHITMWSVERQDGSSSSTSVSTSISD